MSKFAPQTIEEIAGQKGYQWRFDVTYADITQATVSTAQTFNVWLPARAGDIIQEVALFLPEPFQNTADAAYNDTQLEVGDSGDLDNLIVAIQANKNGTLGVFPAQSTGDGLPYVVPATPLLIQLTILSQSGKTLNALNKGRAFVLFKLLRQTDAMAIAPTGHELGI